MALAALICAYHDTDGGALRATLPLAGRPLLERQVRLAASVGARPIVVLVERVPADLLAVVDRLRAEGLPLVLARSAPEAAEAAGSQDRLLLVGDGLLADHSHVDRIAAAPSSAVLTVPDQAHDDRFERIDAESRWGGLALVETSLLRATAAALGDWDLQSTLLRRALQGGARQLPVRGDIADAALIVATEAEDLEDAEERLMAASGSRTEGWVSRYLLGPVEASGTAWAMPSSLTPEWLRIGEGVLIGLSVLLFIGDWRWAGGLMLLLSLPLGGIADRLALLRLEMPRGSGWASLVMPMLAAAALLALGRSVGQQAGWGCALLAAVTIAFLAALRGERSGAIAGSDWLAERKGLILLMLPFAVTGMWAIGLGALAVYAAASFFWAQKQVHAAAPS